MENLTAKQKRVLDFITKFSDKNGHAPTLAEIQIHFGWKAIGSVQDYVAALEKKGHIRRNAGKWSGIEVIGADQGELPLLGKVAAGRPIEYFERHHRSLDVPPMFRKGPGSFFVLEVNGDSMIDEGIWDGDFVVVKKQVDGENGQIVVAMVDEAATIKRFEKKKNHIELHSANAKYKPIVVEPDQNFRIEGVYCGLMRLNGGY